MRKSVHAGQIELDLAGRMQWSELAEACQEQAIELLGQLLRAVAMARCDGQEAEDER
jgi:hypothetical protein